MRKRPTILVDTREKIPWKFGGTKVARRTLKTGDYSLFGLTRFIAVERKGFGDFLACLGPKWKKFQRQLDRLAQIEYSCVIVEGYPSKARWTQYKKYASPYTIMDRAAQIAASWAVPILFAEDRPDAEYMAKQFLTHSHKDYYERLNDG